MSEDKYYVIDLRTEKYLKDREGKRYTVSKETRDLFIPISDEIKFEKVPIPENAINTYEGGVNSLD